MANQRANRVSVANNDGGYVATFYLTHKELLTVNSIDTVWVADSTMKNKILQREMFRLWVTSNAGLFGIDWDPSDRRSEQNIRFPKYSNNNDLETDAIKLIADDIENFLKGTKFPNMVIAGYSCDDITPMERSPKGKDLSTMGILDGKYANGNWAWATVAICAQIDYCDPTIEDTQSAFIVLTLDLVSGQLKKPSAIGSGGYNMTGLKSALVDQIPALSKSVEITESPVETIEEQKFEAVAIPEVKTVKEPKPCSKKGSKKTAE